eukprot:TRINITY_DN52978_c0_g1_i1.p1 TRINITY_DN52978_c0_g1~~TRINITY_DN52978_c0_g1_i1.p1  ORF type:complete len:737 (+),score=73.18 TRINITY_DN52978_c0_g1_i1:108-2318(+)
MATDDGYEAVHGPLCITLLVLVWVVSACLVDCRQLARSSREYVRQWFQTEDADDASLGHMRWEFIMEFNAWATLAMGAGSISIVVVLTMSPGTRYMTKGQDYMACLVFALLALIHFFSEAMRQRLASRDFSHAYYLVAMALMSLYVVLASDKAIYISDMWMMPFRLALCLLPFKKNYFLAGSLMFDAAVTGRILLAEQDCCSEHMQSAVVMHAFMTPALIFSSRVADTLLRAENKANHCTIIMYSAARRMLDLLADVLLELCQDLSLVDDAPKFAAMLFLNTGNPLAGVQLTNFMTQADKQHFSEILLGVGAGHGPDVGALNVSFIDSFCNPLHVEAFYIHIAAAGTKTRYLIGLRERNQMENQLASLPRFGQPAAPGQDSGGPPAQENSGFLHDLSDSSSSMSSSAGSSALQYAVQDKAITGHDAKVTLIEDLLKRCSFTSVLSHSYGSCCRRHQAIKDFLKFVVAWQHEPCETSFSYNVGWQCDACGVLHPGDPDTGTCQVCARRARSVGLVEQPPCPGAVSLAIQLAARATGFGKSLHDADVGDGVGRDPMVAEQGHLSARGSNASANLRVVSATADFNAAAAAAAIAEALDSVGSERTGSAATTATSKRGLPIRTNLTPTSPQAVRRLADGVLRSWNFVLCQELLKSHSCCRKHCSMEHLLRLLVQLQRHRCDTTFSQYDTWQCGSCRVLDDVVPPPGRCSTCLHPAVPERPASHGATATANEAPGCQTLDL